MQREMRTNSKNENITMIELYRRKSALVFNSGMKYTLLLAFLACTNSATAQLGGGAKTGLNSYRQGTDYI